MEGSVCTGDAGEWVNGVGETGGEPPRAAAHWLLPAAFGDPTGG